MNKYKKMWSIFKECVVGASKHSVNPLFWCSSDNMTVITVNGTDMAMLNRTDVTVEKMRAYRKFIAMVLRNGVIVTDNLFDELSEESKKFVLFHEKAHVDLGVKSSYSLKDEIACDLSSALENKLSREDLVRIYDELELVFPFGKRELKKRKRVVLSLL